MNHAERERIFLELFQRHKAPLQRLCFAYLNRAGRRSKTSFRRSCPTSGTPCPAFAANRSPAPGSTASPSIPPSSTAASGSAANSFPNLPTPAAGVQQNLEDQERLAALRSAIAELPGQDRLIITLLLEGLSYREIAEVTGLTVNYVGVKLSRIKHTIEQRMTEVTHGTV